MSVVTRSGTRDFHATGYYFYRHEGLNANNFFNNRSNTQKAPYRYRINGYTVGGPVSIPKVFNRNRDKLFFFWSQEFTGMRRDYPSRFSTMPTEAERNGDFSRTVDVSGRLVPVTDPTTGAPFPGNIIPQNRINSTGQSILRFFPLPNYTDPDPTLVIPRSKLEETFRMPCMPISTPCGRSANAFRNLGHPSTTSKSRPDTCGQRP